MANVQDLSFCSVVQYIIKIHLLINAFPAQGITNPHRYNEVLTVLTPKAHGLQCHRLDSFYAPSPARQQIDLSHACQHSQKISQRSQSLHQKLK